MNRALAKAAPRASLFVLVLAGLAQAQLTPLQRTDLRARLSVQLVATGEVRATLTVPARIPDSVGPVFARAFGCQPADLQPEQYAARLNVRCRTRRSSSGLHTRVRLSELAERLGTAGVTELRLEFAFPKLGDVTITPSIAPGGSYRIASYLIDEAPPEIAIDVGINQAHVRTLGAGIAALLLLPFLLLLLKPRTPIHLMATTQALFLLSWTGWTWVLLETQAWTLCELASGNAYVSSPVLFAAPLAAVWIGSRLAAIHYARLAPPGANVAFYRTAKACLGGTVVFVFMAIFGVFAAPDEPVTSVAIGVCGAILCVVRLRLASQGASHPLAAGELRERVFALAARAGVPMKTVTILTGSETRPPAAFATRRGGILLTDGLLKRLSRREVAAVVCHELSHNGPKSRATISALYVLIIGLTLATQFIPGTVMLLPLFIPAMALAFKAWRRREERAADRNSIRWSQDPEAMILGLARVSHSNGMPLDWGAPMSWMLSHPSTGQRLRLIAAAGDVPQPRLAELIEQAKSEAPDHYEEPAPAANAVTKDAAFSPVLRQKMSNALAWYALAGPAILGVGTSWALEKAGLEGMAVFAIGAPAAMAAFYLGYETIVGIARETARRRAIAKNGAGIFVGFSPSSGPRIYEGIYHYDFGLVRFSPGVLELAGDRAGFRLDSRLVERVRLGDGPRHWTPRKVVYVEYRDPDGMNAIFSLQSFEARIWPWTAVAAHRLYAATQAWRVQPPATAAPAVSCDVPRVKGDPDRSARPAAVTRAVAIYSGVGLTVTSVFGMANLERGFDWAPALLCAALAIFVMWPQMMKPRTA